MLPNNNMGVLLTFQIHMVMVAGAANMSVDFFIFFSQLVRKYWIERQHHI